MTKTARTLLLAAALPWTAPAGAAEPPPAPLDEARSTLSRWVETQALLSQERRDWQDGKEILESRIQLLQREIAAVEEKTGELRGSRGEAEAKRLEILEETQALQEAGARLAGWATELEAGIRTLYPRLPEPLQQRLSPLFNRMPDHPETTQLSLAERFQNVAGILNEVQKANGEIALATEVRTLASGKPAEVKTVYVGLAQAYFVSVQGEAGVGVPGDGGWTWTAADDLAPAIQETVEVLQGKAKPRFVPLPVQIR